MRNLNLNLKCNHLNNPLSVNGGEIVLTFKKGKETFNKFLLGISSSKENLLKANYDIYSSEFEDTTRVKISLSKRDCRRVFWHIKTNDFISETAFFEWAEDFDKAQWVSTKENTNEICVFKKDFTIQEKPTYAKIQVCGLGFYNGYLNNVRFEDYFYKPNFSDYKKRTDKAFVEKENYRAFYDTYDVTDYIHIGNNALTFSVAGGYFHNVDRSDAPVWDFGNIRVKFNLILYYGDEKKYIYSDESCSVCKTGNFSTLFLGNRIDFRKNTLAFNPVSVLTDEIKLCPTETEYDVVKDVLYPKVIKEDKTERVYDFLQNHTGDICCKIRGAKGTKVTIRFAEVLTSNGLLNLETASYEDYIDPNNIPETFQEQLKAKKKVYQENEYILSGGIDEIYPLFNWRCYRYIQIVADNDIEIEGLKSLFIYSNLDIDGRFECSEPIFNDIYKKYIETQKCNMHSGIISDCPHREKMPYSGDGQLIAWSVLYNFESEGFYKKWLKDIIYSQSVNGFVPNSAPDMATGGGYFWGFAIAKIPEVLYAFTGDTEYLNAAYKSIILWVEYLNTRHNGDYILFVDDRKWLLSDWLAPESISIDCRYFSSVCFYLSVKIACKIHEILYKSKNEKLIALQEKIREAINKKFFDYDKMCYSRGVQGETVLALYCGIPEKKYVKQLNAEVRRHYVEDTKCHLDTGIVMTPILMEYLTKNGMEDLAYAIMTQKDYPSYAYLLEGETTIPEHWSKRWVAYSFSDSNEFVVESDGDVSHCHPMYGSIVSWLFEYVAGLNLSESYKKTVQIHPKFINEIKEAKVSKSLLDGDVFVCYNNNDKFVMTMRLPKGYRGKVSIENISGNFKIVGKKTFVKSSTKGLVVNLSDGEWTITQI